MTESKAMHQVLILDNDKDFVSLLQNKLSAHGFEIQAVNPNSDKIHSLNLFQVELIIIAVDSPEMIGYTLYDRTRKKVGKFIPIVLTTATLSPEDFTLHKQLKEPADAYLDKRRLVPNEIPPELYPLIGVKPQTESLSQKGSNSSPLSKNYEEISISKDELNPSEELNAKGPMIVGAADRKNNEKQAISSHAEIRHDQKANEEIKIMDKLKHALSDFENEASHLFEKLDKKSHDIGPSQPLNHVLNQKDQNGQRDWEINNFIKKIQEDNKRVLAKKEKLRKFMEEMFNFEKEIDQDLKRNKELSALLEIKQKMIDEAKKSAEMLTQEKHVHQETRKQLESKVAQLQAELIGSEKQHLFQLNASEEKFKTDLLKAKEEQQHALKNLNENYTAQISQFRAEKNAEIKTLKEIVSTEMQKIAEMLTNKEKVYQESCEQYESRIAQLQAELEDSNKQQISQLNTAEEKHKTSLHNAEEYHSNIVDSIVKKFAAQLAQIRIDMDNERQAHQKNRKDLETKITQLSDQKESTQERMASEQTVNKDEQKDTDLLKENE